MISSSFRDKMPHRSVMPETSDPEGWEVCSEERRQAGGMDSLCLLIFASTRACRVGSEDILSATARKRTAHARGTRSRRRREEGRTISRSSSKGLQTDTADNDRLLPSSDASSRIGTLSFLEGLRGLSSERHSRYGAQGRQLMGHLQQVVHQRDLIPRRRLPHRPHQLGSDDEGRFGLHEEAASRRSRIRDGAGGRHGWAAEKVRDRGRGGTKGLVGDRQTKGAQLAQNQGC